MAQQRMAPGMKSTITPGDPLSRMMGQYGKGHSFATAAPTATFGGPIDSTPTGASAPPVRDPTGGIKKNPRQGGLGPGPNGSYGSPRDYGKTGDQS